MTLQSLHRLIESLGRGDMTELDRLRTSQVWEPPTLTKHNNVFIEWEVQGVSMGVTTHWTTSPVPKHIEIAGKLRENVTRKALEIIEGGIAAALEAK